MKQKIIKAGNSLAVTIPAQFCADMGIKSGDEVEVDLYAESGKIVLRFFGSHQLILSKDLLRTKAK